MTGFKEATRMYVIKLSVLNCRLAIMRNKRKVALEGYIIQSIDGIWRLVESYRNFLKTKGISFDSRSMENVSFMMDLTFGMFPLLGPVDNAILWSGAVMSHLSKIMIGEVLSDKEEEFLEKFLTVLYRKAHEGLPRRGMHAFA